MYKLPCPDNVLYLELVGKQATSGDMNKSGKCETCDRNALYKDNRDDVNISLLWSHPCDSRGFLSLHLAKNCIYHEAAATLALFFFYFYI